MAFKPHLRSSLGGLLSRLTGLAPTVQTEALRHEIQTLKERMASLEAANPRLIERCARFVACEMIPGDYLEFGVYRGNSLIAAYDALRGGFEARSSQREGGASDQMQAERKELWQQMRFFAFDSFAGLPELVGVDKQTKDFAAGQYAATEAEFRTNIAKAGVDLRKVVTVPGWFQDTCRQEVFARHGLTKAAVVWIDCDLYESAKAVLAGITPLLQNGTVLIFDDWHAFRSSPNHGEQRAFREWQTANSDFTVSPFHKEGTWRNSFLVARKQPA
jgi:O-methyltransferase